MKYLEESNITLDGVKYSTFKHREFESINELYRYICDTPLNEPSRFANLSSTMPDRLFTGTNNYEEAIEKLMHGDDDIAKRLVEKANTECKIAPSQKSMTVYDVVGYQASVPRYLQGVPNSMINKRMVAQKQKVITITKSVGYIASYTTNEMIEESIKTLKLIKQIEQKGIRCNLYVCSYVRGDARDAYGFRVKVKNANERLNMSKLAFTMAHPSMLRRIAFRYREVMPEGTKYITYSMGTSINPKELFEGKKGEYFIPSMVGNLDEKQWLRMIGM